jgi:DNA-binding NtrC family response regulator
MYRVLIADDEPHIRLALRACLVASGYDVREAADGAEALEQVLSWAPDVMILDLAMPNLDGLRTLGALEGVHGQLKPGVVVLTAWGSPPAAMRAIGLGASSFVEKPADPETIRRAVRRAIIEREIEIEAARRGRDEDPSNVGGIPIDWNETTGV